MTKLQFTCACSALVLTGPVQAQFFSGGSENELILSFRNAADDVNVGYDIGPVSAFAAPGVETPLLGVEATSLAAAFDQPDLSNLRFSVAGYDMLSGVPVKTHLWLSSPPLAGAPTTSGSAHNLIRTAISTTINTYRQEEATFGSNARTLDREALTTVQWSGSYSALMGADPGKWGNNTTFGTEANTGADFNDPGDRIELDLWYLPGNVPVGQPADQLGTIALGYNDAGVFYASYTPTAVPEPSVASLGWLGILALVSRRRWLPVAA